MSLATITSGRAPGPRRILLYGTAGIGKSTWASCAPGCVFIPTEDGLADIDCHRFPVAKELGHVHDAILALYKEDHGMQTVAIDSLDCLERLIWARVCETKGIASIDDMGFGRGYVAAMAQWREVLEGLSMLRQAKKMTVILIAHSKIERYENPEAAAYDRYMPRIHKSAAAIVSEWCDEVLFASYKVFVRDAPDGKGRPHGIGTGERVLRTTERPSHIAKNRLNLPDELPLVWSEFAKHITTAAKA